MFIACTVRELLCECVSPSKKLWSPTTQMGVDNDEYQTNPCCEVRDSSVCGYVHEVRLDKPIKGRDGVRLCEALHTKWMRLRLMLYQTKAATVPSRRVKAAKSDAEEETFLDCDKAPSPTSLVDRVVGVVEASHAPYFACCVSWSRWPSNSCKVGWLTVGLSEY